MSSPTENGKRKGAPYVPSYMDLSNGPEPCVVCGDAATGYHYRCMTCEGCKGFFRRTIQKELKYQCKWNSTCVIDKTTRNQCQLCRFVKCIAVGMATDLVLNEKQRKAKRKLIEDNRERRKDETTKPVVANEDHILTDEDRQLICNIVVAYEHTAGSLCTNYSIPECDSSDDIGKADPEVWHQLAKVMTPSIVKVVEFAKGIPDFKQLKIEDQILLLKSCCMEIMCLRTACKYDPDLQVLSLQNGLKIHRQQSLNGWGMLSSLIEPIFEFAVSLSKLKLDQTETALLAAVLLMQSDRSGLTDPESVERLQDAILGAYKRYIADKRPEQPVHWAKILMKVTDLRTISTRYAERVLCIKLDSSGEIPPLFLEIFNDDIPIGTSAECETVNGEALDVSLEKSYESRSQSSNSPTYENMSHSNDSSIYSNSSSPQEFGSSWLENIPTTMVNCITIGSVSSDDSVLSSSTITFPSASDNVTDSSNGPESFWNTAPINFESKDHSSLKINECASIDKFANSQVDYTTPPVNNDDVIGSNDKYSNLQAQKPRTRSISFSSSYELTSPGHKSTQVLGKRSASVIDELYQNKKSAGNGLSSQINEMKISLPSKTQNETHAHKFVVTSQPCITTSRVSNGSTHAEFDEASYQTARVQDERSNVMNLSENIALNTKVLDKHFVQSESYPESIARYSASNGTLRFPAETVTPLPISSLVVTASNGITSHNKYQISPVENIQNPYNGNLSHTSRNGSIPAQPMHNLNATFVHKSKNSGNGFWPYVTSPFGSNTPQIVHTENSIDSRLYETTSRINRVVPYTNGPLIPCVTGIAPYVHATTSYTNGTTPYKNDMSINGEIYSSLCKAQQGDQSATNGLTRDHQQRKGFVEYASMYHMTNSVDSNLGLQFINRHNHPIAVGDVTSNVKSSVGC